MPRLPIMDACHTSVELVKLLSFACNCAAHGVCNQSVGRMQARRSVLHSVKAACEWRMYVFVGAPREKGREKASVLLYVARVHVPANGANNAPKQSQHASRHSDCDLCSAVCLHIEQ